MRGLRASTLTRRVTRLFLALASHARGAGVEEERLALLLPILLQRDNLLRHDLRAFLDGQLRLLPGVAALMKADDGREARIRKGAGGHLHVADFDVALGFFLAETNRMNWN